MAAIIGKKVGMTQLFREDGTVVPVTVIEAGPCPITGIRSDDRDGYTAVQLAFDATGEGKLTKAELGHLKKATPAPCGPSSSFATKTSAPREKSSRSAIPQRSSSSSQASA